MANASSNWQNSLNYSLVNRLTRPLSQPGMMKMAMSQDIINRCDRFLNRLPLLNQQMQRWGKNITFSSDDVPIVYAQPVPLTPEKAIASREQNVQPTVAQNNPSVPLIQRKVDASQSSRVQIQNTESSPPSALTHPYPLPRGESGRTEYQNHPELKSDPAELQAKFSDLQITSANPSQINSDPRSRPDEVAIINQIGSVNTSQINSDPRSHSDEVTIINQTSSDNRSQINSDSRSQSDEETIINQISSVNPSPINSDPRSQTNESTINNQTATSETEMPIVSPQTIAEKLTKNEEMSLVQEFTSTAQIPLPIIQAKQQNSSRSTSSLPIVNPSNTIVTLKQTQQDNHDLVKLPSINNKKSEVTKKPNYQNMAPLPIVTITSQVNSSSQTQSSPLPLANNSSGANTISQKPNRSNQSSIGSNTTAASSPRIFVSPSPPTQTFVSTRETQPKIDLDVITSKVEKRIMRRLVIESERRGKIR